MKEHLIVIENGEARFVWHDDLVDLTEAGRTTVTRASHVEPHPAGGWVADMGPSDGPVLLGPDGAGFRTRQAGLDAEREWLRRERGL